MQVSWLPDTVSEIIWSKLNQWGGITLLAGVGMTAAFVPLACLPTLRGQNVIVFLSHFLLAGAAYCIAVSRLGRDRLPRRVLWAFAILFRLIFLTTSPTLSDDVYRYIWDGHLLGERVNPYALEVNSPALDAYSIPQRAQVNHNWMASPYLPVAQLFFGSVTRIAPQSVLAFQIASVVLDLFTGWLLVRILKQVALPRIHALIYLWNPLVVVEFSHGAHVDALMLFFITLALYFIVCVPDGPSRQWWLYTSAIALAAATLTKGLPLIVAPFFLRRWGWRRLIVYVTILVGVLASCAVGAGWGLFGALDGRGLFGALRIYLNGWSFNSGINYWLETGLSSYQQSGRWPAWAVGADVVRLVRWLTSAAQILVVIVAGMVAWRWDGSPRGEPAERDRRLLRLCAIPIGAYLLLTPTLHPWYVTLLLIFLPFLSPAQGEKMSVGRFIWPWVYFSIAVALSYLTYIDPNNLREFAQVRLIEYIPLYLLLIWAAWPLIRHGKMFKRAVKRIS